MVHQLAKLLSVLFVSVILGFLVSIAIASLSAGAVANANDDSFWISFIMINDFFGWLIYAIPFAIIGFKIYPEPKTQKKTTK